MSDRVWLLLIGICAAVLGVREIRRRRAVKRMSLLIRRVMAGDDRIDLREYRGGELAALAADVQKLTLMLREKESQLSDEKRILLRAIGDISHQLKTPLTSILMYAELLSRSTLEEDKRKAFAESAERQIARLEWLVQSLLLISKLDAKAIVFRKEAVSLADITEGTADPLRPKIAAKGQSLEISGDPAALIETDRNWLIEALSNLLKNAHDHAPEGASIKLRAEQFPLRTVFSVENSGAPIPPEDLGRLFERFYRGHGSAGDSVGIGLEISRSLVHQLGGDIEVESCEGRPTVFRVIFPR